MEQFGRLDYADAGHGESCPTGSSPAHQPTCSENLNITIQTYKCIELLPSAACVLVPVSHITK